MIQVKFNKGEAFFGRGDIIHAGDGYDEDNIRLHWFGDYPKNGRDHNHTYLYNESTQSTTTSGHYYKRYFEVRIKNAINSNKKKRRTKGFNESRAEWCRKLNKMSVE